MGIYTKGLNMNEILEPDQKRYGGQCSSISEVIAPNTYVNCDIESHSVVFGNPCIVKHRDNATEGYVNRCV